MFDILERVANMIRFLLTKILLDRREGYGDEGKTEERD